MDDLPNQINADDQASDKKDASQNQQIQPPKMNDGAETEFVADWFDNVFKFIGGVAIVCWMIHEFVFDAHKIFLFSAISLGLADAFYVLAHKILKSLVWLILCWVLYAVCTVAIFKNEAVTRPESPPTPTVIAVPQPDFIEGTEYTRKQIEEAFPYGYEIIHLNTDGEKESREFSSNPLPWQIDWKKIKIEPNFASGRVIITVPNADFDNANAGIQINGTTIRYDITLKKGLVNFTTVYVSNKPCLYLVILSVDQRQPVFVFGYGIWNESHPGLPNFPAK